MQLYIYFLFPSVYTKLQCQTYKISCFGSKVVWHVSTKIEPYGHIIGKLCVDWEGSNVHTYLLVNLYVSDWPFNQSTSIANTSEALIIFEDICDKNKTKNDVNNPTNNNHNLDNDDERVRKDAINVENQLKEIRKSMLQRYQNGQRKTYK